VHATKGDTGAQATKDDGKVHATKSDAKIQGTKLDGTSSKHDDKPLKEHDKPERSVKADSAKPDAVKADGAADRHEAIRRMAAGASAKSEQDGDQLIAGNTQAKQFNVDENDGPKRNEEIALPFAALIDRARRSKTAKKLEAKAKEKQPAKEVRRASRQRTQYTVKEGDTLESIAETELKDMRFSNLILTINRGRIAFVSMYGMQLPELRVGQVLWLPTEAERDVYARTAFSSKKRTAIGRAPGATRIVGSGEEREAANSHQQDKEVQLAKMLPEVTMMIESLPPMIPAAVLDKIRKINQKPAVSLRQIECQLSGSQLLDKLNGAAENASASRWIAGAPAGAAEQRDKKGPKTQFPKFFDEEAAAARLVIERLAATCRMVTKKGDDEANFNASLEMEVDGKWTTVVCYEYRHGHGYRYNYYSNGDIKPFPMDLPLAVVLEMAREDFQRNWTTYCREFSKQNGASLS
jgi:hypothetical protein